jgi:hypothetical protein
MSRGTALKSLAVAGFGLVLAWVYGRGLNGKLYSRRLNAGTWHLLGT